MAQHLICRQLAIVSIDLSGYSGLMEQDETGTHRALMACRSTVLEPVLAEYRGQIVKSTGDGALITFACGRIAVECMIDFQRRMAARTSSWPSRCPLVFRVGIHVAQAIMEDGDLYGNGVNLAVRLQEAAEPGTIYVSKMVADQLPTRRGLHFEAIGMRALKNLKTPIALYRWRDAGATSGVRAGFFPWRINGAALAATIALGVLIIPSGALRIDEESGAAYRPKPVDEAVIAPVEDRAGHYPLRGSFLDGRDRRRLQVRANDVTVGGYRWNERLDRGAIGAAVTDHQVSRRDGPVVSRRLAPAERSLQSRSEIADELYADAWALYSRTTPADFREAMLILDEVLTLQPSHDQSHALLAAVYWGSWRNRWQLGIGATAAETLSRAQFHLNQVARPTIMAHAVTSEMLTASGHHVEAIAEAERGLLLEPAMAVGYYAKGLALLFDGRPDKAEGLIQTARRLDPRASRYLFGLAFAQFNQDRFTDAFSTLHRILGQGRQNDLEQNDWPFLLFAATSGHLGRHDDARHALGRFDQLSVPRRGWFATQIPFVHGWPFRNDLDRRRLHDGMILAGIPRTIDMAAR
ncbi:MAG: adenylate/guanylate cyclase domain-containing protein [Geminicoccaceae bacterium]